MRVEAPIRMNTIDVITRIILIVCAKNAINNFDSSSKDYYFMLLLQSDNPCMMQNLA